MKKLLLSLATALLTVSSALAGSYTIEFKATDKTTDQTGAITASDISSYISNYTDVKDFISSVSSTNVYKGTVNGVRIGSGSNGGTLTINLTDPGKVKATSFVVSVMKYNKDSAKINVNEIGIQNVTETTPTNHTFTYSTPTDISSIVIKNDGGGQRVYVKSITVNYEDVQQSTALGKVTYSIGELVDQHPNTTPIDVKRGDVITFKAANATHIYVDTEDGTTLAEADGSEVSYTIADVTTVKIYATGVDEKGQSALSGATVNFNIAKSPAGIGFANEDVTMTIGEAAPLFNNPNTLDVTCTSTNDKVAYMDETGAVKVLMPGTTTITATTVGNDDFEGGEAVLNLTVRSKAEASVPATDSNTFTKVTTDDQIAAGNQYVVISKPNKSGSVQYGPTVLGSKSSGKGFDAIYLGAKDATEMAESYTIENEKVTIFVLEKSSTIEKWYAKSGDKYLKTSDGLSLSTEGDEFSITTSTDNTVIDFGTPGKLQFYRQNKSGAQSGEKFSTYTSNQTPVFLYVREKTSGASLTIPAIVPTFDEGDEQGSLSYSADGDGNWLVFITKNGSIELKAAEDTHSVFYSMENQTSTETPSEPLKVAPKDGFQAYDAPILLGDEHKGNKYMIKFYAADENGVESPVESLVVDYTKPTGIEAIEAETEAVYFDLQGNRVAAPETGVYIKVVGGRASKVLF